MSQPAQLEKASFEFLEEDAQKLAALGYKQEFKREFNSLSLFCFAFSMMGVLASVSASIVFPMSHGGPVSMIWGWLTAASFVMSVALMLAELCSSMPTTGGLYYFAASLSVKSDKELGWMPLIVWLTGWFNVIGNVALVASIDWSLTQMVFAWVTLATDFSFVPTFKHMLGLYFAFLVLHGIIGSLPTKILAAINNFYVLLNLVATVVVIVCLFVLPSERNSGSFVFTHFDNATSGWNDGFSYILGMLDAMWTLCGYGAACNIAEECRDASRAGPRAIIMSVVSTVVAGWLILLAATFSVADINEALNSELGMPMIQIMYTSCGKQATLGLWMLVILVQLFTGSSAVIATSRVIFAFSRDGALPFSKLWDSVNSYTQTPVNAVWINVLGSALLGLLGFIDQAALDAVFNLASIGIYIAYGIPIFCRITIGRSKFKPGPFSLGKWSIPVGSIACAWICFIVVSFLFPYEMPVTASNMNYAVVVLGAIITFAGIWYAVDARKWFKGPRITIETDVLNVVSAEQEADSFVFNTKDEKFPHS
ncbi:amino acid transporter [Zychaea mexicana]|uniref:amino acid transporter n=1 Tax=Zychaea mexicana TaxID=64656 RepID=UPI0022FF19F3|nr:amino acid transporter [Zychaea mexicana]KAI9491946.1 amino acid transporter [Zychaea mexicana]